MMGTSRPKTGEYHDNSTAQTLLDEKGAQTTVRWPKPELALLSVIKRSGRQFDLVRNELLRQSDASMPPVRHKQGFQRNGRNHGNDAARAWLHSASQQARFQRPAVTMQSRIWVRARTR